MVSKTAKVGSTPTARAIVPQAKWSRRSSAKRDNRVRFAGGTPNHESLWGSRSREDAGSPVILVEMARRPCPQGSAHLREQLTRGVIARLLVIYGGISEPAETSPCEGEAMGPAPISHPICLHSTKEVQRSCKAPIRVRVHGEGSIWRSRSTAGRRALNASIVVRLHGSLPFGALARRLGEPLKLAGLVQL